MGKKHRWGIMMAFAAVSWAPLGHAASDAPMIVASIAQPAPHFMPLAAARSGMAGVRIERPSQVLRSDRAALNAGFMRIDRARMTPIHTQHTIITPVAAKAPAEPVQVIEPEQQAVLDLFGDDASVPEAAPALTHLGRISHIWPIAKSVTQRLSSVFGMRKDPFHGRPAFHGGIDIAAATGTPVLATADGVVSNVSRGKGLGNAVSVRHRDGSESIYGHLSAQSVRIGQHVAQGQKLGEVGSTGRSTGPHLDYRLKKNGELVNPMTVLRQPTGPSRTNVASNSMSIINGVKIIR